MKTDCVDKKKNAIIGIGQIHLLSLFLLNFMQEYGCGHRKMFDKYLVVLIRREGGRITLEEAWLASLELTDAQQI